MLEQFPNFGVCFLIVGVTAAAGPKLATAGPSSPNGGRTASSTAVPAVSAASPPAPLAAELGVEFVADSTSTLILERGGKRYRVDLVSRTIAEVQPWVGASASSLQGKGLLASQPEGSATFKEKCSRCHGADGQGIASIKTPDFTDPKVQGSLTDDQILATIMNGKQGTLMPAWSGKLSEPDIQAVARYVRFLGNPNQQAASAPREATRKPKVYEPGDDVLLTLPTGRRLERHGFYVNFAHRFPYDTAFTGKARGGALSGLDGFAIPSFGFRYGVTDKLSVSIFRAPSVIGRPIQLMAAYNLLDEHDGRPINLAVRFSVEGQNNFSKNHTENFEGVFSRSLTHRAQLYFVPTVSLDDRPLQQVSSFSAHDILDLPGHNTVSLGVGGALDIRPTVALVAEGIPTVINGRPLGIHRPAYAFGIQKKIWRHSFTFGFTNSPGTTVSERAGTRASFLGDPTADKPGGLFVGFDLTRQIY
jgi:mono/diheme cytochrome c family protein